MQDRDDGERGVAIAVEAVRAAAEIHTHFRQRFDPQSDDATRAALAERADNEARAAAIGVLAAAAGGRETTVLSETALTIVGSSGELALTEPNGHARDGTWRRFCHDTFWVIDGLDGVANFRRGLPFCCATVGYVEGGQVQFGATYAPALGELFSVVRGRPALLNGCPITTSRRTEARGSMVCSGAEIRFGVRPPGLVMRNMGSHALSLAYVACGRTEGYISMPNLPYHLGPWDCAVGTLLIEAAGGYCGGPTGGELDLWAGGIVACSSRELADLLVGALC